MFEKILIHLILSRHPSLLAIDFAKSAKKYLFHKPRMLYLAWKE